MPFTPFHFGPGLLLKSIIGKRFSFIIFVLVQVLIDFETAYNILKGNERLHTTLHTYLGSLIVVVLLLLFGNPMYRISAKIIKWYEPKIKSLNLNIDRSTLFISSLIGAWSHVFLDSIMHFDIAPLAPLSQNNPFLSLVSLVTLHLGCVISAIVGGTFLLVKYWLNAKSRHA